MAKQYLILGKTMSDISHQKTLKLGRRLSQISADPPVFPITIMLSGGHEARPYISKRNSSSCFKTKIRGFRSDTILTEQFDCEKCRLYRGFVI